MHERLACPEWRSLFAYIKAIAKKGEVMSSNEKPIVALMYDFDKNVVY